MPRDNRPRPQSHRTAPIVWAFALAWALGVAAWRAIVGEPIDVWVGTECVRRRIYGRNITPVLQYAIDRAIAGGSDVAVLIDRPGIYRYGPRGGVR